MGELAAQRDECTCHSCTRADGETCSCTNYYIMCHTKRDTRVSTSRYLSRRYMIPFTREQQTSFMTTTCTLAHDRGWEPLFGEDWSTRHRLPPACATYYSIIVLLLLFLHCCREGTQGKRHLPVSPTSLSSCADLCADARDIPDTNCLPETTYIHHILGYHVHPTRSLASPQQ